MRTAGLPEGLAAMPPGLELAAALRAVPVSEVPNDRMLEWLAAQYRQLCHEQARMAAVLAELSRCTTVPGPGVVVRADAPDPYAAAETRAALRWTRHAADVEHGLSETVVHGMPELFAAWSAGKVDRARVSRGSSSSTSPPPCWPSWAPTPPRAAGGRQWWPTSPPSTPTATST